MNILKGVKMGRKLLVVDEEFDDYMRQFNKNLKEDLRILGLKRRGLSNKKTTKLLARKLKILGK